MSQELEICCWCDGPTGKAGRGEDSIYVEALETVWGEDSKGVQYAVAKKGYEIGPLCESCRDGLIDDGCVACEDERTDWQADINANLNAERDREARAMNENSRRWRNNLV